MPRQLSSLSDARRLIAAGEKKAEELGVPYNIAVVDAGGGVPLKIDNVVVGALGASGGTVDQDVQVATAVAAFGPKK